MKISKILAAETEMNLRALSGTCKRKQVGCAIVFEQLETIFSSNGPSSGSQGCSNIVGNCGCSHAEPRAILILSKNFEKLHDKGLMICTYSPCTNCANIILDSLMIWGVVYRTKTEHDLRGLQILESSMMVGTLKEIEESGYADIETWIQSRTTAK